MTGDEQKRFAALNKLMGYAAPTKTGEYQEGRRTTKADTSQTPELKQQFTDDQVKQAKNLYDAMMASQRVGGPPAGPLSLATDPRMTEFNKQYTPDEMKALFAQMKKKYGA
jgi:hypothetical protein